MRLGGCLVTLGLGAVVLSIGCSGSEGGTTDGAAGKGGAGGSVGGGGTAGGGPGGKGGAGGSVGGAGGTLGQDSGANDAQGQEGGANDAPGDVAVDRASVDGQTQDGSGGGIALVPNSTGFIDGSNAAGVIGSWYAFADGYDAMGRAGMGSCQMAGHTDCSFFTTPTPGLAFAPDAAGRMCAAGHIAMVPLQADSGAFDYANVYGAVIALDLNNAGSARNDAGADDAATADAGANAGTKLAYNAIDRVPPIVGVAFDIDMVAADAMRVDIRTNVVPGTTDVTPAYWGGATQGTSPVVVGHNSFRWGDVGGPVYLPNPPPFDPTKILTLDFGVLSNPAAPFEFSFCIGNLTLLTN